MEVANGIISTTTKVWNILRASFEGDLEYVKKIVEECPELIYAQYNYTPPIHFAVREGHVNLVEYLLNNGAYSPNYRTYPFLDSLETIAEDRGHSRIAELLTKYALKPELQKFGRDNGQIFFERTELEKEFEETVDKNDVEKTRQTLSQHPEYARDETYFWGEGILMMPAKENHHQMIELLIEYGAKVPDILKWTQAYYFEHPAGAPFMMEKGMNPDTMSWHQVTILHDMAQKGNIPKAELLIRYGANLDLVEEEYQSTPLGLAARWGQFDMVQFLIDQGADVNKSGASWSTPLQWARKKSHFDIESFLVNSGAIE